MKTKNATILVTDDSIMIRKKFKMFFETIGYTDVIEACNGQEAIELYKKYKPTVVFMDIVTPIKSGLEALQEILAFDEKAKVVMASSVGTQVHITKALQLGAYDFLQKPIDFKFVEKLLNRIIADEPPAALSLNQKGNNALTTVKSPGTTAVMVDEKHHALAK